MQYHLTGEGAGEVSTSQAICIATTPRITEGTFSGTTLQGLHCPRPEQTWRGVLAANHWSHQTIGGWPCPQLPQSGRNSMWLLQVDLQEPEGSRKTLAIMGIPYKALQFTDAKSIVQYCTYSFGLTFLFTKGLWQHWIPLRLGSN